MSCMMSNVGVEQRGRWEMEFSMGRRSICLSESTREPGKGVEQRRKGPFVFSRYKVEWCRLWCLYNFGGLKVLSI